MELRKTLNVTITERKFGATKRLVERQKEKKTINTVIKCKTVNAWR